MLWQLVSHFGYSISPTRHGKKRKHTQCTPISLMHEQKTFQSGQNGCVRVDALHLSHSRHPGGEWLCAHHQDHTLCCIVPSDCWFTIHSCSVSLLFETITLEVAPSVTTPRDGSNWVGARIRVGMWWVTLQKSLIAFLLLAHNMQFSLYSLYISFQDARSMRLLTNHCEFHLSPVIRLINISGTASLQPTIISQVENLQWQGYLCLSNLYSFRDWIQVTWVCRNCCRHQA
jgi:hypothetical protein